MGRPSVFAKSAGIASPIPASLVGSDMGLTSRWPFDSVPVSYFRPYKLVVDVLLLIALVLGTAHGTYCLFGKAAIRMHFGLRFLFGLMTLVAVLLVFVLPAALPRQVIQHVAESIIALSIAVAAYGVLWQLYRLLYVGATRQTSAQ